MSRLFIHTIQLLCLGAALFYLSAVVAFAHDAAPTKKMPLGWSYPFSCCSGIDCRQVPSSAIGESHDGYVIKATGETVPYGDKKIKDSPDGEFHWCSVGGKDDGKTICLFVPPPSY